MRLVVSILALFFLSGCGKKVELNQIYLPPLYPKITKLKLTRFKNDRYDVSGRLYALLNDYTLKNRKVFDLNENSYDTVIEGQIEFKTKNISQKKEKIDICLSYKQSGDKNVCTLKREYIKTCRKKRVEVAAFITVKEPSGTPIKRKFSDSTTINVCRSPKKRLLKETIKEIETLTNEKSDKKVVIIRDYSIFYTEDRVDYEEIYSRLSENIAEDIFEFLSPKIYVKSVDFPVEIEGKESESMIRIYELVNKNRLQKALKEIDVLIAKYPDSKNPLYAKGLILELKKEYKKALKVYTSAFKRFNDHRAYERAQNIKKRFLLSE